MCAESQASAEDSSVFIVIKLHWINDDDIVPDINPLMIDTGAHNISIIINMFRYGHHEDFAKL